MHRPPGRFPRLHGAGKKKIDPGVSSYTDFVAVYGRRPGPGDRFALHLNRKREFHRLTAAIMYGVSYALGSAMPDGEVFESITGSADEAKLLKKQHEAMRNRVSE